ncbi:unnamed protein product, partial [Rotaria sp. Silwood2]
SVPPLSIPIGGSIKLIVGFTYDII